jgi:tetraacyldisaccharide 4'-kinase
MRLKKPKFWDYKKPSLISFILSPFTIVVIINNFLLNFFSKEKNEKIKSICVGNIYIGGTGKTPTTIKLYQILKSLGYHVGVGKKFYSSQKDEQIILNDKTNLITDKKRKGIIKKGIEDNFDVIIFDDGLQDKAIDYNIKFVCFNVHNWIGNGFLIPSGPLRETIDSLRKYDAIIFKQIEENIDKEKIINQIKKVNSQIKIFYSEYFPINLDDFDLTKKYLIFSGIGDPNSFKNLLTKNNFNIVDEVIYPDHYKYTQKDLDFLKKRAENLEAQIITTEKDFTKISEFICNDINILKIDLKIKNEEALVNFLKTKIHE